MISQDSKVTAKAMKEVGFTYDSIGDFLGVSKSTAYRYVKEMSGDDWQQFREFVSKYAIIKESGVLFKVLDMLDSQMSSAKYSELVSLYQTILRRRDDKTSGVVIGGGEMKIEFIETDSEKDFIRQFPKESGDKYIINDTG